jgi:hypothetical protein
MTNPATMVQLLGAIRDHLAVFRPEAEIATVTVDCDGLGGDHVIVHLRPVGLPHLASALLAWIDTLTAVTVTAWRPPHGLTVHLNLTGELSNTRTQTMVYGGVDFTEALFGDLQPDGRQGVALSTLRAWATGDTAVAA